jgi:hypothetical protein
MTVPILTLMVPVVAFGAEVGWLMAEPHNLQNCEIVRGRPSVSCRCSSPKSGSRLSPTPPTAGTTLAQDGARRNKSRAGILDPFS